MKPSNQKPTVASGRRNLPGRSNSPDLSPEATAEQPLSFPFSGKVTSPSFAASLATWVRSGDFPRRGPRAARLRVRLKESEKHST
jgi:hypothetical protein